MEPPQVKRIEIVARIIAKHHYDRKEWFGCCSKVERTQWLVDTYWRQFIPAAEDILSIRRQFNATYTKPPRAKLA